jgi:uncharacterized membrane protein
MEPKRSKYDTNPLDDEVVAHAEQSWGSTQPAAPTGEMHSGPTSEITERANETAQQNPESEAPTRRIDEKIPTSYPSIFIPPPPKRPTYQPPRPLAENIYLPPPAPPPSVYQRPDVTGYKPGSNTVSGLGIPEKWAVILPYLPFYLALVIALVELLLVPRTETRVRFHASQALALQIGITAISVLLTFAGLLSGRFTGASLFNAASFVCLIIAMIRVWKGKPVVIPPLDEPRKWLDEKIKPRK